MSPARSLPIVALLALLAVFVSPSTIFAQSRVGISLSPPLVEDQVLPGATVSYTLRIENKGDTIEQLYPRLYDVSGISRDGQPEFAKQGESTPHMLSGWVTFDNDLVVIPPQGSATLRFTVHVPDDASPGAHVGSVALSREAPTDVKQGTGVGYEVRSIVSLRIAGDVIERTKIKEFFTSQVFFTSADVLFTTTILNEGNVFARPKGFIDIKNMFGTRVDSLPVNDGGASAFPNSERAYTTPWKSDKFHIGKYTAELTLTVEGATGFTSLLSSVEFWVIPTHIVLPALGGLLATLIVFWVILRLYIRAQIRRATGGRSSARAREATSLSRLSVVVIGLLISVIIGLILLLFILG